MIPLLGQAKYHQSFNDHGEDCAHKLDTNHFIIRRYSHLIFVVISSEVFSIWHNPYCASTNKPDEYDEIYHVNTQDKAHITETKQITTNHVLMLLNSWHPNLSKCFLLWLVSININKNGTIATPPGSMMPDIKCTCTYTSGKPVAVSHFINNYFSSYFQFNGKIMLGPDSI